MDDRALWTVATLVSFALGIALFVRRMSIPRRDAVRPAHAVPLDAALYAVRATKRRAALYAIAEVLAFSSAFVMAQLFALVALMLAFGVQDFLNAWRVERLLESPRASAELRGQTLTACSDGTHASLVVSVREAGRARANVPRAIVR